MAYTGLQMFMDNLKHLIHGSHNPLINNNPLISSERPQFQLLYQELDSIIQTLSSIHQHHQHQELQNLKKRFKDAAEEAQDTIDLFLSALHFTNKGLSPRSDIFKTSLDLENVMRSIESVKLEFMTIKIDNMKMDLSSHTTDSQQMQSAAAAGTSCTRNLLRTKKVLLEDIIVGLDDDTKVIVERLIEDRKMLDVVSIVGMGGLGKTTLATKVFNDPYVVHHFYVRAWVTVSQTYEKRDVLVQILASIAVEQGLEEASYSQLREKLHKHLIGRRYLIVIDDIWSIKAWDDLKLLFPHDNKGSRILLTSRVNEVAFHAKPHGFVHSLPYLTEEESWELLRKKVFRGDECPECLIKPGMQIAENCQGLPLSVVVMAGILAKETMSKDSWENFACRVGSYQKGNLETLALSYYHLPSHLRECFLYLGGFPEDVRFVVERLIWLWVAEGFIEEAGNRSLEDTAKAYLMDLIDRNLVIVAERNFNGDVKACKLHDLVRELCLQKAKEERFFHGIEYRPPLSSQALDLQVTTSDEITEPYKQRRVFTNQDVYIVNLAHSPTPSIRSLFCFHTYTRLNYDIAEHFHSFALLRVLDLQKCQLIDFPEGITFLVHLRYLAIWYLSGFPSSLCNLWSLQTLVLKTSFVDRTELPSNISNLVNLRHLWSNKVLYLPSIGKPMNLQSISNVMLGYRIYSFQKCFPGIKKLKYTVFLGKESHFELLPYLETLKITVTDIGNTLNLYTSEHNQIWFPATLKKLTLVRCHLPWSDMSIIQSLPNLEVLKLKDNAFVGTRWNTGEQQFQQLKVLRFEELNIKHWEAYSTSFPCLRGLTLLYCNNLEEIPLEIGKITTLELIETDSWNNSVVESVKGIKKEQHDEGNTELKITVDGIELSIYSSEHEGLESEEMGTSSECSSDS